MNNEKTFYVKSSKRNTNEQNLPFYNCEEIFRNFKKILKVLQSF